MHRGIISVFEYGTYSGFCANGISDKVFRQQDLITDSGQLLILNNKKTPVARIVFDGLMITGLGNIPMNSSVADAPIIICDATFQFTSYDIKDP